MRTLTVVLLLTVSLSSVSFATKSLTLEEAVKSGFVEVKITGDNASDSRKISMECTSIYKKDLELSIESGLMLASLDTSVQDMIITKGIKIDLPGMGAKKIKLHAMCTQQSNKGPLIEDQYCIAGLAEGNLWQLAKFIETKRHQNDAAQHAIWVLTDESSIAGIYDVDAHVGREIRLFMKQLTGIIPPWYQVEYQKEEGVVFTNKPAIIHADFKFTLKEDGKITLAIYDSQGNAVQSIVKDKAVKQGIQGMKLRFEAYDVPPGQYFVRVHDQGNLVEEKIFEL